MFIGESKGIIYVYIGAFTSPSDPRARATLNALKTLPDKTSKSALRHATIKPMPRVVGR